MTFLRWIGWAMLAVTGGLLLLRYLPLRHPGLISLVVAVPYLPFVMLPATVGLLASREWIGSAIGITLITLTLGTQLTIPGSPPPTGDQLRVLSINVAKGTAESQSTLTTAREQNADIVAIQELTPAFQQRLTEGGINDAFPYSIVRAGQGATGTGLWSRIPLAHTRELDNFGFACVAATFEFDGAMFDIVATHITAPVQDQDSSTWVSDLAEIGNVIQSNPYPTIIAGDFNSTLDHKQFRDVLHLETADAARQAGRSYARTFPADWSLPPFTALDHILVPKPLRATDFRTVRVTGSDHLGIVSTLSSRGSR
ncbi:endonuclease/exonuclease/phosphatase family protein [Rhodococcus sp. IEGM 1366]|uniref:endonuclease/exonuclease/phosphatase family protein n=1 Tax=Rhodococcus sp. IEGM 1366 TaxID=3082223 RepID=UPI0029555C11|nr:endonuclease/exonuclease/phosphatase family protein [Rhodococcus sp. IEGM 1366]MDV8068825.1 endonuclease/exonuclease/phosphatase family protein [Rhodococcus sp. IEGM 1366]